MQKNSKVKLRRNFRKGQKSFTVGPLTSGIDRSDRIFTETFRFAPTAFTASLTAGTVTVTELNLNPPNWGTRGIAFADLYQNYRIVGLRINGKAHVGQNTTLQVLGNTSWYIGVSLSPTSTFTVPSTVATFIDLPHVSWVQDFSPNNISLRLSRNQLMRHSFRPWYRTSSTGVTDQTDLTQVTLEVLSVPNFTLTSAPSLMELIIEFDVEFCDPIDPALIPSIIKQRLENEEKKDSSSIDPSSTVFRDLEIIEKPSLSRQPSVMKSMTRR